AEEVAQRIERRLEAQRLLKPRTVRLSYKDVPVADAINDFVQKTGFNVQIPDTERAKINRRINLDTGELPFWEAYQRLCEAAGLVERPPQPVQPQPSREVYSGRRRILILNGERAYAQPTQNTPVVLLDGKPAEIPTAHAGALRLRVVGQPQGSARGQGEFQLPIAIDV